MTIRILYPKAVLNACIMNLKFRADFTQIFSQILHRKTTVLCRICEKICVKSARNFSAGDTHFLE